TTFDVVDGQPIQVIHAASGILPLPQVDLRSLEGADQEIEALRIFEEEVRRPFDLKQGPLVRAVLVRMSDIYHRLCIVVHQIIVDGVSVYHVLLPELAKLYEA